MKYQVQSSKNSLNEKNKVSMRAQREYDNQNNNKDDTDYVERSFTRPQATEEPLLGSGIIETSVNK